MKIKLWDALQIVGSICSISGIIGFSLSSNDYSTTIYTLIIIGTLTAVISSILARRPTPVAVSRDQMIRMGNKLIAGVKNKVVMFGGDMSWADDYEESINKVTSQGKSVIVICPRSNAQKVVRNKSILSALGAVFIEIDSDLGLRAMIIDPDEQEDAMLYLVKRTLKQSAIDVSKGEKGTSDIYEYKAKVYTYKNEPVPLQTMIKVYHALEDKIL